MAASSISKRKVVPIKALQAAAENRISAKLSDQMKEVRDAMAILGVGIEASGLNDGDDCENYDLWRSMEVAYEKLDAVYNELDRISIDVVAQSQEVSRG